MLVIVSILLIFIYCILLCFLLFLFVDYIVLFDVFFVCIFIFVVFFFFFSSRGRHTRCALVTGVQTCALPIYAGDEDRGMSGASWSERLCGGFRRTSERLGENLAGLTGKTRLGDDDLDRIEEALITADLGPAMAARIRERLAARRDEIAGTVEELRESVADEIATMLRPVAEPPAGEPLRPPPGRCAQRVPRQ